MVKPPKELIDDGKLLVARLDLESPYLVIAAFWAKGVEESNYRLRLRIKELESVGPTLLYKHIQKLIKKRPPLGEVRLEDVLLIKDGEEILKELRTFSHGAAMRDCFVECVWPGILVEGSIFVHRVN